MGLGFFIAVRNLDKKGMQASSKLVLMDLAIYANEKNKEAWPGNETLAKNIGISLSSVFRAISELESMSIIKKTGHGPTRKFRMLFEPEAFSAGRSSPTEEIPLNSHGCEFDNLAGENSESQNPPAENSNSHGCDSKISPVRPERDLEDSEEYLRTPYSPPTGGNGREITHNPSMLKIHEERFERFYGVYPLKKGKGAARKAWMKIKPDDVLTKRMIAAIEAQEAEKRELKNDREFCPAWKHPSTWLNQECWEDEVRINSNKEPPRYHRSSTQAGNGNPAPEHPPDECCRSCGKYAHSKELLNRDGDRFGDQQVAIWREYPYCPYCKKVYGEDGDEI